MTLTVRLDDEEADRLEQLVETLKAESQSSLIRQLILEKWNSLQTEKTFLERRGEHPRHLLQGSGNASERSMRKAELAKRIVEKATRRKGPSNGKGSD